MPQISIFRPTASERSSLPLADGVTRHYVHTVSGELELLYAEPSQPQHERKTPIFFAHGGCGSAYVWLEWMHMFAVKHNIPCYAISYRGHGASWYPSFLRMYFTTKTTLAGDIVAGIAYVRQKEGKDVVLVGHSSGGALSQLVLSNGMGNIKVQGLVLCGAMPCFGGHLGHPVSPLSSAKLVKRAFFSDGFPMEKVALFEQYMPKMESFAWPLGQLFRFGNFPSILQRITGWGTGQRVLVLAGEKDRLVDSVITQREAQDARAAVVELATTGKIKVQQDDYCGVRYYVVIGAGHHMQNDLQLEDGARELLEFYKQL